MDIMGYITWIIDNGVTILTAITSIIGAAAVLAKLSPTPKDDEFFGKLMVIINAIAMNFGNTANISAKESNRTSTPSITVEPKVK